MQKDHSSSFISAAVILQLIQRSSYCNAPASRLKSISIVAQAIKDMVAQLLTEMQVATSVTCLVKLLSLKLANTIDQILTYWFHVKKMPPTTTLQNHVSSHVLDNM